MAKIAQQREIMSHCNNCGADHRINWNLPIFLLGSQHFLMSIPWRVEVYVMILPF